MSSVTVLVYPKDVSVTFDTDDLAALELAASALTYVVHLPGLTFAVPVASADVLVAAVQDPAGPFVELPDQRWINASLIDIPNARKRGDDYVRLMLEGVVIKFDIFRGKGNLAALYGQVRAAAAQKGKQLPIFQGLGER